MKKYFRIGLGIFAIIAAVIIFNSKGNGQSTWDPWDNQSGSDESYAFATSDCHNSGQCFLAGEIGDLNGTGSITPTDIILLQKLMERIHVADVNGDTKIDDKDIEYLTKYVYLGGPAPKQAIRCSEVKVARKCPGVQPLDR